MASPAQLMQAVSDATGLPVATIVDMDRRLVTGGLRTKGGRGLNAAKIRSASRAAAIYAEIGPAP